MLEVTCEESDVFLAIGYPTPGNVHDPVLRENGLNNVIPNATDWCARVVQWQDTVMQTKP